MPRPTKEQVQSEIESGLRDADGKRIDRKVKEKTEKIQAEKRKVDNTPSTENDGYTFSDDEYAVMAKQIMAMHQFAYLLHKQPEFIINEEESIAWCHAFVDICRTLHIPVVINLAAGLVTGVITMGAIYAPRILAMRERKEREKAEAEKPVENTSVVRANPFEHSFVPAEA